MIFSLFADAVAWFRGSSRCRGIGPSRRGQPFGPRPRVEVLEDRCLPSATTTVPSPADIPPIIAVTDYLFATQPKGNPSVIFVGDSISWEYAYGSGAAVWSAFMAPLNMASYGVIGQTTQSLLYEFSLGLSNGINPAVVVLEIGGNNLLQGDTPQATAAGIVADVVAIHQSLPQSQILVLGVLPGMQSPNAPYRLEGTQTDQLAAQILAGLPYATFVNVGSVFLQPDGTISSSVMSDYLHPTQLGYLELTSALLPVIGETLLSNPIPPTASGLSLVSLTASGGFQMSPTSTPLSLSPS
jgi:lysophospholipase L1-like esterase